MSRTKQLYGNVFVEIDDNSNIKRIFIKDKKPRIFDNIKYERGKIEITKGHYKITIDTILNEINTNIETFTITELTEIITLLTDVHNFLQELNNLNKILIYVSTPLVKIIELTEELNNENIKKVISDTHYKFYREFNNDEPENDTTITIHNTQPSHVELTIRIEDLPEDIIPVYYDFIKDKYIGFGDKITITVPGFKNRVIEIDFYRKPNSNPQQKGTLKLIIKHKKEKIYEGNIHYQNI